MENGKKSVAQAAQEALGVVEKIIRQTFAERTGRAQQGVEANESTGGEDTSGQAKVTDDQQQGLQFSKRRKQQSEPGTETKRELMVNFTETMRQVSELPKAGITESDRIRARILVDAARKITQALQEGTQKRESLVNQWWQAVDEAEEKGRVQDEKEAIQRAEDFARRQNTFDFFQDVKPQEQGGQLLMFSKKRRKVGEGAHGFIRNLGDIFKAEMIDPDLRSGFDAIERYNVQSHKEVRAIAENFLRQNTGLSIADIINKAADPVTDLDDAARIIVIGEMTEQSLIRAHNAKKGGLIDVFNAYSQLATDGAQIVADMGLTAGRVASIHKEIYKPDSIAKVLMDAKAAVNRVIGTVLTMRGSKLFGIRKVVEEVVTKHLEDALNAAEKRIKRLQDIIEVHARSREHLREIVQRSASTGQSDVANIDRSLANELTRQPTEGGTEIQKSAAMQQGSSEINDEIFVGHVVDALNSIADFMSETDNKGQLEIAEDKWMRELVKKHGEDAKDFGPLVWVTALELINEQIQSDAKAKAAQEATSWKSVRSRKAIETSLSG